MERTERTPFDPAIAREMIDRHHDACWGWALHCSRHAADEAEEVLQTTYLKVLEGKARFSGRSGERTWLFGVIRHTAAERRRRRMVRFDAFRRLRERRDDDEAEPATGLQALVDEAVHRRLHQALDRLSPRQRDLLHLVFYQELTIEEASRLLGISLGTARVHYERGKKRLRQLLAGAEPTDETVKLQRRPDSQVI